MSFCDYPGLPDDAEIVSIDIDTSDGIKSFSTIEDADQYIRVTFDTVRFMPELDYSNLLRCAVMNDGEDVAQYLPDFGTTTQVTGTIEDVLPPECMIEKPVDVELAWKELQRSCRGG